MPGPAILAAAAALAALVVGAAWRLRLVPRLLLPFGPTWRTALLAGAAFFLGALLDTSYGLFSVGDMAIGRLPFRLACALGSGLVLAGVVLAWPPPPGGSAAWSCPAGGGCCCWPWR